ISPILLEHPAVAAKGLVELRAVSGPLSDAEIEVALVSIFLAATIEPGIQVRIGNGFFNFMRQSVGHAIRAAVSIGRRRELDFAAGRALIHVTYERPFDVCAID